VRVLGVSAGEGGDVVIYASCREDFWSTRDFGPLVFSGRSLPAVDGARVLIAVHGYNSRREDVERVYGELERATDREFDEVVGFCWPGGSLRLSYWPAKGRADRAARYLHVLCLTLLEQGAREIHINAHSLGARVALRGLERVPRRRGRYPVDGLYLVGAAVDDETLTEREWGRRGVDACRRVVVAHSRRDPVLRYWYLLGDFDRALGSIGPEHRPPAHVELLDVTREVTSHGGYRRSPSVLGAMRRETSLVGARAYR
jgi:esterase/lipase superfamily enzyme